MRGGPLPKINEQMVVLMEEKKGDAAAFDQLMSERRNVTGDIKGLCDQRDVLNQEIQAQTAVRPELILKEHFEVMSLAPQTDCRASRRCANASQFQRDLQSGLAPTYEQISIGELRERRESSRRRANASQFHRDRQSGLAPTHEQISTGESRERRESSRRRANASQFQRYRQSGLAPTHEQISLHCLSTVSFSRVSTPLTFTFSKKKQYSGTVKVKSSGASTSTCGVLGRGLQDFPLPSAPRVCRVSALYCCAELCSGHPRPSR